MRRAAGGSGEIVFRVLFAGIIACIAPTALVAQDSSQPKFTELSPRNMVRLDRQRALISATVRERYGSSLTQTTKDLPVLQRLVDDSVFNKSQTYELQCLGIAFGDVLASALPLRWVMVTDEFGTDPTLRYKNSSWNVNALTMVSKRVERGEKPDLSELLRVTRDRLAFADPTSRTK